MGFRTLMLGVQIAMSSRPWRARRSSKAAATAARVADVEAPRLGEGARCCRATASALPASTSRQATRAPSLPQPRATASPMPEPAPITAATLPSRRNASFIELLPKAEGIIRQPMRGHSPGVPGLPGLALGCGILPDREGPSVARRRLLRYLAASPILAALRIDEAVSSQATSSEPSASPRRLLEATGERPIAAARDAINVFDYEVVARRNLPPAHYGYLATGVDDDRTQRANREAFERIQIRARRLVDVTRIDTATELFGRSYETPLFLCPAASQRAFHPEGELAVARAARSERHLQMLSTDSTTSVEEVIAARGEPVFLQLYPTSVWAVTERLVKRAEAAGCSVLVLTVDLPVGSNRETSRRYSLLDSRRCTSCHGESFASYVSRKPMFAGIDVSAVESRGTPWA